jgi:hypothetical protein
MVQNRVDQRRAAGIVAVRHHHHAGAVVGQQMQIAIVPAPGAAVMTITTGTAIMPDKEAEALLHRADFGKTRAADIYVCGAVSSAAAAGDSRRPPLLVAGSR